MAQPIVGKTDPLATKGGAHTGATVVADNHDVLHLEHIDGELDYRETVEVGVDNDIGDIAMNEQFTGKQPHDLIGRHTTV